VERQLLKWNEGEHESGGCRGGEGHHSHGSSGGWDSMDLGQADIHTVSSSDASLTQEGVVPDTLSPWPSDDE